MSNNCVIDLQNRKNCKYCRIQKCYEMGMKKEFIRTSKQEIKDKENKVNERALCCTYRTQNDENIVLNNIIENFETNDERLNQQIREIEYCLSMANSDGIYNNINDFYHEMSFKPVFRQLNENTNSFNELETKRLYELFRSSEVFKHKSIQTHSQYLLTDMIDVNSTCLLMLDRDVDDMLKFTKNLDSFRNLCFNDQLALIKYGCLEMLLLRYSILYDIKTDYWTWVWKTDNMTAGTFKLDVYKPEKRNMYVHYKNYLHKLLPEWNRDYIVLDLLTAIVLFNPHRPKLIYRDVVKSEQQLYLYLLQRYLYLKHGSESETQRKLSNFMNSLTDLQNICEIKKKNGHEFYLKSFGPILKEILYDMTSYN
ncbi:unnamed protein product [Medioppia subpectinata]|uniref:Uncharacterized protein n=1 Tax=Medioppia subpectinata TaxID=1979941 RepID=A0A7R9KB28_9ACAR|nr:unnamed protein product [Medioppia subpectinata]CAG2100007.1 unnamed protein product [Medioppia subpectinata]